MSCGCSERKRRDYRARITGPIADRIDVVRYVEPLAPHDQRDVFSRAESSEVVRRRVALARRRQADRYAGCSWRLNAHTPGPQLRDRWRLDADAQRTVDEQVYAGQLTGRGAVRVNRLAWTVLDLLPDERTRPGPDEVEIALRLRRGEPLLSSTLRRAG